MIDRRQSHHIVINITYTLVFKKKFIHLKIMQNEI